MTACGDDDVATIQTLLADRKKTGIDVNAADFRGWTPLLKASCNGHTEAVRLLLDCDDIQVDKAEGTNTKPYTGKP